MKGALVFFLSFLIWLAASFCYIYHIGPSVVGTSSYSTLGQLGDSFGIINSLLSALVVAGVYLTYAQQRETIELERSQIRDERNASAQKTIEDRFFKMLEAHQSLVNSLAHSHLGVEYTGKIALLREYERLVAFNFLSIPPNEISDQNMVRLFNAYNNSYGESAWWQNANIFETEAIPTSKRFRAANKIAPDDVQQKLAFSRFYDDAKSRISHYFSSMISMLTFIGRDEEKDGASDNNLTYYLGLIKAQLSPQEQALLFYYNRFKAKPDEKTVLEKSGLFQDISSSDLIHPSHTNSPPSPASGRGNFV